MRRVCVVVMLLFASLAAAVEVGDTPAVSVREAAIRQSAGFLSPIVARLDYGESVEVLAVRPGWARVQVPDAAVEGWIHESAVATKESLRLEATGEARTTATSREIALAGRGFNEQVEARYESEKGLDFTEVDTMEVVEIQIRVIGEFLADGDLGENLGVQ